MTRLDTDILQVSSNRLNPYVMVDIYEKGSRGQPIARHLDKTVAMKGNGLNLKKNLIEISIKNFLSPYQEVIQNGVIIINFPIAFLIVPKFPFAYFKKIWLTMIGSLKPQSKFPTLLKKKKKCGLNLTLTERYELKSISTNLWARIRNQQKKINFFKYF